jgi:putative transposase
MEIFPEKYYHLYNRSNNREKVFHAQEKYIQFLGKYRRYSEEYADTIAYCLMPTHFHFLVYIKPVAIQNKLRDHDADSILLKMNEAKRQIGTLLSSYTKSRNKKLKRHGSLFQRHTKAIEVDDVSYLLSVVTYIHQNPVRAKLVSRQEEWEFSSYRDYVGMRNGTLPKKEIIFNYIQTPEDFKKYSEELFDNIERRYWV